MIQTTNGAQAARRRTIRATACLAAGALAVTALAALGPTAALGAPKADVSPLGISLNEFESPSMEYRPGVRWWWSGGAVETAVLAEQLEYLAANGYGTVEINPFGKALPADDPAVKDIYTDAFYDKLEFAVAKAQELGITVDLNMGTAWNANSQYVKIEEGQGNMALGRTTLTGAQIKAGSVTVPALAKSNRYVDPMPKFDPTHSDLQAVLVAERTGVVGAVTGNAARFNDGATTWGERISLNSAASFLIDGADISGSTFTVSADVAAQLDDAKQYEVVGLYYLPAGTGSHRDGARPDWFTVDHMDAAKTLEYINEWVGDPNLKSIVDKYDNVRALFNDSLELGTDLYYTESLYDLARDADNNGLGYDFTKYLPTVYAQASMNGSASPFLTYTTDSAVTNRILFDFRKLVGQEFEDGLKGFQQGSNNFGLQFRQQAYNPPMDMIGAAEFVDIPEEEQADEFRLRTASSGAHLFDRNLVTAEQFTLGFTPYQNSLDTLKAGIDLMATSGVNNFFYHGLAYPYGQGTAAYGENGWSPFWSIGEGVQKENTLSKYYSDLNSYAARLNYIGQQGSASSDVAVYAPFNTRAVNTGATPVLNANGYTWDVINDGSIVADDTTAVDGKLSVNGGNMEYDALIVHTQSVPVATMEALQELADAGAPIIFYGALPNQQSGYADGAFAAEDAKVQGLATAIVAKDAGHNPVDATGLVTLLDQVSSPELTWAPNENVRAIRRTLDNGAELMYIRNIATTSNTITVNADAKYENFYWLDQEDGSVYRADVVDGEVTFTLEPGKDTIGRGSTQARPSRGIVLLAEPAGVRVPTADLTDGSPEGLNTVAPTDSIPVAPVSLTVEADNLDGTIGGSVESATFTANVLGNWKEATFQGGQLRSVVSDGVYKLNVHVPALSADHYELDLGTIFTAATVRVNGEIVDRLTWAPYRTDVTEYLQVGDNEIEITVTPRGRSRYFPAATNANGQYTANAPLDAGLVGPVILLASEDTVAPKIWDVWLTQHEKILIEATDSLSGVASIEYSTQKNKQSASAWKPYTGPLQVDAKSNVTFRVTDEAGNVSEVTVNRKDL